MQEDRAAFIEGFALKLNESGMQRMAARVFAALLTAPGGGLTAREIAETLDVSAAAVSGATTYLTRTGLVERTRTPARADRPLRRPRHHLGRGHGGRDRDAPHSRRPGSTREPRSSPATQRPPTRLEATRDFFDVHGRRDAQARRPLAVVPAASLTSGDYTFDAALCTFGRCARVGASTDDGRMETHDELTPEVKESREERRDRLAREHPVRFTLQRVGWPWSRSCSVCSASARSSACSSAACSPTISWAWLPDSRRRSGSRSLEPPSWLRYIDPFYWIGRLDIPWPDIDLPGWLTGSTKYWVPIVIALVVALGEIDRRRKKRRLDDADSRAGVTCAHSPFGPRVDDGVGRRQLLDPDRFAASAFSTTSANCAVVLLDAGDDRTLDGLGAESVAHDHRVGLQVLVQRDAERSHHQDERHRGDDRDLLQTGQRARHRTDDQHDRRHRVR